MCPVGSFLHRFAHESLSEDALMTANNNVTEALQRTLVLMQGELEKSVLSTQLLGMPCPMCSEFMT